MPKIEKIAFLASDTHVAEDALRALKSRYGHVAPQEADVIVALGGDGFMLQTLQSTQSLDTPVYGMNRGTVGFLMNEFNDTGLTARLADAERRRGCGFPSTGANAWRSWSAMGRWSPRLRDPRPITTPRMAPFCPSARTCWR